jgi:hypothetical protein
MIRTRGAGMVQSVLGEGPTRMGLLTIGAGIVYGGATHDIDPTIRGGDG